MQELLLRSVGRNVAIDYEFTRESAVIHADSTQIQQILLNLCVNSRDAMEDNGRVHIKVDFRDLDQAFCRNKPWARPGSYVMLQVADDGCGMDTQILENLFEPFFTTKQSSGGTGLGLATVYGIVKQHQGLLEVESDGQVYRRCVRRDEQALDMRRHAQRTAVDGRNGLEHADAALDDQIGNRELRLVQRPEHPVHIAKIHRITP